MFNRIVIPLDGTPFAEAALAPACELARAFGSRLALIRAVVPSRLPRALASGDTQSAIELVDDADAYLHGIVEHLRRASVDASIVLYIAEPGAAIARAVEIDHADLVVMTAHPRWHEDFLDDTSTTLQVLARSRAPILAWRVGSGVMQEGARDRSVESAVLAGAEMPIVVPLDGSHLAEAALPVAESLARAFGSHLVLVRAFTHEIEARAPQLVGDASSGDASPAKRDAQEYLASAYLRRMRADIEGRGLGVTAVAREGHPPGVIDAAWREHNAGLVVMASHGNSGAATSLFGSVAARTIEEVGAPVLVLQPDIPTAPDGWALRTNDVDVARTFE